MSLSTHHTVPTSVRSGGPLLVGLLGTSVAFLVAGLFPSALTLALLAPALVVAAGAIAAQIQQGRAAFLSVVLGSLLACGVVCVLIFWDTVTGPLSSNFYPWVVVGEIVGVAGVLITVALGYALGTSLGRRGR